MEAWQRERAELRRTVAAVQQHAHEVEVNGLRAGSDNADELARARQSAAELQAALVVAEQSAASSVAMLQAEMRAIEAEASRVRTELTEAREAARAGDEARDAMEAERDRAREELRHASERLAAQAASASAELSERDAQLAALRADADASKLREARS